MILAFDPGNETGWAVKSNSEIIDYGVIRYKKGYQLKYIAEIQKLYEKFLPKAVVIEQPFSSKFPAVIISLTEKVTLIQVAVRQIFDEALIIMAAPADWKKSFGLKGNAKKEEIQNKVKEMYKITASEHASDAMGMATAFDSRII